MDFQKLVDVYEELIRPLQFDLLADVPTAATPLVSSLSDRLGVGMVTPRTDAKTHGSGASIDGLLNSDQGKRAVLIDDLVTMAVPELIGVFNQSQEDLTNNSKDNPTEQSK